VLGLELTGTCLLAWVVGVVGYGGPSRGSDGTYRMMLALPPGALRTPTMIRLERSVDFRPIAIAETLQELRLVFGRWTTVACQDSKIVTRFYHPGP
jgi:hypothetical protein